MTRIQSHPNTWVRAIRYAIGSQGVGGREPAALSECLYPHLPAITAAFEARCTMAKCGSLERIVLKRVGGSCQRIVWLSATYQVDLMASDI